MQRLQDFTGALPVYDETAYIEFAESAYGNGAAKQSLYFLFA